MFEWDDAKSEANLRNRGFDFAYAALVFDAPVVEVPDQREDYGEQRIQVIGRIDDTVLFVIYTWRGDTRRIISARLANRRERDVYRQALG
jgi:uncharacterized DUF497 family protein